MSDAEPHPRPLSASSLGVPGEWFLTPEQHGLTQEEAARVLEEVRERIFSGKEPTLYALVRAFPKRNAAGSIKQKNNLRKVQFLVGGSSQEDAPSMTLYLYTSAGLATRALERMGQKLEEEETKGPRPKELGYLRPPLRFGEVLAVVDIGAEELMHGLSRHPQIETIRVYGESGYVTTMDRTFRPVSREKYSLADLF